MKRLTSSFGVGLPGDGKSGKAATVLFVALALIYAASGVLNALRTAAEPATGVLRETMLVLLPSIAAVIVLWITNAPNLSPKGRRFSLAATLIVAGLVATISAFGA